MMDTILVYADHDLRLDVNVMMRGLQYLSKDNIEYQTCLCPCLYEYVVRNSNHEIGDQRESDLFILTAIGRVHKCI